METRKQIKERVPRAQLAAVLRPSDVGANPGSGSLRAQMSAHEGERHSMLWAKMTDRVVGAPAVACFEHEGVTWFGFVPGQVSQASISLDEASFDLVGDGAGTFRVEFTFPVSMEMHGAAWQAFSAVHEVPARTVSAA
jgi:hypothetical protein